VAGSIFTFSLTLGDFITPLLVGGANSNFIGNVIYSNIGTAGNLPFAAALAGRLVPIPVESVAVTGPQVTVVDMPPHRFQKTPTWYGSDSKTLAAAETISIGRR